MMSVASRPLATLNRDTLICSSWAYLSTVIIHYFLEMLKIPIGREGRFTTDELLEGRSLGSARYLAQRTPESPTCNFRCDEGYVLP
jgi:hypothetical protein